MQTYNLDDIPFLIANGKIPCRAATRIIWEEAYLRPWSFGLADLSEDDRSDFLISFTDKTEAVVRHFLTLENTVSFRLYLRKCIGNAKQSWLRKKIVRSADEQSVETFAQGECEADIRKYETRKAGAEAHSPGRATRRVDEMAALVLTMKACHDVDDELIEKVAGFTGFGSDFIHKKVQELKERSRGKEKRRELLVRRRDNSFYFRRRYQIEMSRMSRDTKAWSELAHKFSLHGRNWQKNNEILSRTALSPSADQIALALGMRPRQVRFYISHIKRPENAEKIKRMVRKQEARTAAPADKNADSTAE